MEDIKWWHRIKLSDGTVTPGICFHGKDDEDYATNRFGLPLDLKGKTVLDIGCWDGYFSFEAEKRGAKTIIGIDIFQNFEQGGNFGTKGFVFAKENLKSKVQFENIDLMNASSCFKPFDVTFFFGVLYHTQNPVGLLKALSDLTKEYALIETTICDSDKSVLEIRAGYENDSTNLFYPSIKGMGDLCKLVGFKEVQLVYNLHNTRATFKAIK